MKFIQNLGLLDPAPEVHVYQHFSPRDKYGHESESDSDDRSSMSDWISPTPYQTQGKVSGWKVRSPAKSQVASHSQRGKVAVVRGGSPRKKSGAGRKMLVQTGQKDR